MTAIIILSAIILDIIIGELPNRFHPVAWTGNLIAALWEKRPAGRNRLLFLYGILLTLAAVLAVSLAAWLIRYIPYIPAMILTVILLKLSFSIRGLFRAAIEIRGLLVKDKLENARIQTSRHLVSRSTDCLDSSGLSAAVIESVTENLTDSFTSPVLFYVLAGLPGAWAYRAVNTCDAMIGYRRDDYEWGGKFAARLDDVLNFIPARLTAEALILCGLITRKLGRDSLKLIRRSAALTDSPNAGHTMAAMAVILGIRLEKSGYYVLNDQGRAPVPADITSALWFSAVSLFLITVFLAGVGVLIHGL